MSQVIDELLEKITPQEKKVIRLYYGIGCESLRTFQNIANEFGRSRERIRQIHLKAFRKLRHPSRLDKVVVFGQYYSLEKSEQRFLRELIGLCCEYRTKVYIESELVGKGA